ncbi:unnamed protein product [Rotaria sordida]|uniref:B30.2/SPRY domain-containing protein n=1 Tax=Rotaria sordida TaxID=392033 RepID=A0A818JD43_9BILA|nr:unnamed protein product [Rotaria sordida]
MASSSARKYCANVNGCKQTAAALCEGCSQALCTKHFIDHRRLLDEEMDVIISEYNQFQNTFNKETTNFDSHPLIQQINEWEKESIVKIQQKAQELRQNLLEQTSINLKELSKKLQHLSEQLKEGREHDSFVETDLCDWKKSLDDLKANLTSPSTFRISQDDRIPLVQNVFVHSIETNEVFEQVFNNNVRIEENGLVAIHDAIIAYTEIRGKTEYTSGHHKIRLYIEQSSDTWIFLGINSKSTPLQNLSYSSTSTYGWASNNFLWLNGQPHLDTSTYYIEMKINDVISLIFDCDNSKILMINERTNARFELIVNIDHCPFPWQLHVILYEANSRVRILSN